MRTVHKYALEGVTNQIDTYEGARFLHVANQQERICVWAEVDTTKREQRRTVHLVGTGWEVPPGSQYRGSAPFDGGAFVFHVYIAAVRVLSEGVTP